MKESQSAEGEAGYRKGEEGARTNVAGSGT